MMCMSVLSYDRFWSNCGCIFILQNWKMFLSSFDAGVSDGCLNLSVGLHGNGYPPSSRAPVDPGRCIHRKVLHCVRQERWSRGVCPCQVVCWALFVWNISHCSGNLMPSKDKFHQWCGWFICNDPKRLMIVYHCMAWLASSHLLNNEKLVSNKLVWMLH